MPFSSTALLPRHVHVIKDVLTWVAPPLAIPALRYFQDPPEQRNKLFARDFFTYSLGAGLFFVTRYGMEKALNRLKWPVGGSTRSLMAFLVALGVNLLYAGIGAIRMAECLFPNQRGYKSLAAERMQRISELRRGPGLRRVPAPTPPAARQNPLARYGNLPPTPVFYGYYPYTAFPVSYGLRL